MALNNYETVFIANPEIADDAVAQLIGKIKQAVTDNKGTMANEDRWGRRRLAYPIHGNREGFYVVLTYSSEGTIVNALEHVFRVTDSVIRHLTIRVIKKNKTFPPRRVKPAGATSDSGRPGGRPGYGRDTRHTPSAPAAAPVAAAPAAPAAPAAETPNTPPASGATPA